MNSHGLKSITNLLPTAILLLTICLLYPVHAVGMESKTLIVTAEGLVDPSSVLYKKDKGLMVDDLRKDARRQAIEKAVGVYVESSTLVENYLLIEDQVLSQSQGLIKQIIDQSSPALRDDGLMHMQITAEVFISDVKQALTELSKASRKSLLKQHGNPKISVAIVVKDAQRGVNTERPPENSQIAENILKEKFNNFGYRVWSEKYTDLLRKDQGAKKRNRRNADFTVIGEVKFKQTSITLKASGIQLTKHALTSWTVKCLNNHTGEEIYFNNKIPRKKVWAEEDQALEDIGRLIGEEFSQEFFESELMKPSQLFDVQLEGLPDYDTALLFKNEFLGLRPILNADLLNFDSDGFTQFEIESTASNSNFAQILNNTVLKPLNAKLNGPKLKLKSFHGNVVQIKLDQGKNPEQLQESLLNNPPASLATASPERILKLIQDPKILQQIMRMNPNLAITQSPITNTQ